MRNAGKPAFHKILRDDKEFEYKNSGLTKRELIAAMVMQGIVAHSVNYMAADYHEAAKDAIACADELLKQLEAK